MHDNNSQVLIKSTRLQRENLFCPIRVNNPLACEQQSLTGAAGSPVAKMKYDEPPSVCPLSSIRSAARSSGRDCCADDPRWGGARGRHDHAPPPLTHRVGRGLAAISGRAVAEDPGGDARSRAARLREDFRCVVRSWLTGTRRTDGGRFMKRDDSERDLSTLR